MISWPTGVNQTIINETTGGISEGIIKDSMRSGKAKRRMTSSSIPDTFNVAMLMTKAEWDIFEAWFKTSLRRGALSFAFPNITGTGTAEYYTSAPSWSNVGGSILKISMTWETA